MQDLTGPVERFLEGGPGVWLAPGQGAAPDGCVVLATSGSTGEAKSVVLHRDAVLAAARAAQERLGFTATWHLTLAPHYVAGLMVLARGWLGSGVRAAAPDLSDLTPAPGRNCVSIVGTQLYRALGSPETSSRLAAFDAVLVGGGALLPLLRGQAEQAGIRVIETYGMSETCGGVVWDGVPLPGVEVTLDEGGRVAIGGPMLFEGYGPGDQDVDRPASRAGGPRRFLTSDRGRWHDGRLVIEGRVDDVVISGGVNVDLASVRRTVVALEPEAEVLAVDDAEWGARVVLFAPHGTLALWRDRLRAHLPPAALPRQLVILDALPRTPGGKPERKTLLELVQP